jgi:D-amino-acid oxidase
MTDALSANVRLDFGARYTCPVRPLRRRDVFAWGGASFLSACLTGRAARGEPELARVRVAPERVIRTVAGLRPYRPSGFVIRSEKIGDKTVVHHYGHGGCGVTLSWGTADLARTEVLRTNAKRVAILGCGAVGLATARLLQESGLDVVIYAKALPPATTSNIAGAFWYPFLVCDPDKRTPAFMDQLVAAARFAHLRFQTMVGDRYGVRWLPSYFMQEQAPTPGGWISPDGPFRGIVPGFADLSADQHPFPFAFVRRFQTMLIEPHRYLPAVMRDVREADGQIIVREFHGLSEVLALPEPCIVNCTGLGAAALFGDEELTPVKGQLSVLLPQPEVDYAALADDLYMFPRSDGIILGGTHERGVWTTEPDLAVQQKILARHAALFGAMKAG